MAECLFSKITLQDTLLPEGQCGLYHLFAYVSGENGGRVVEERPLTAAKIMAQGVRIYCKKIAQRMIRPYLKRTI